MRYGKSPTYQKIRRLSIKEGTWNPRHFTGGESAFRDLWRRYIRSAKNRKHEWGLSEDQVRQFFSRNCFYCDDPPTSSWPPPSVHIKGSILYNGIDRTDSNIGYVVGNCVSCCKICNLMKQSLSHEEFLSRVTRIYRKAFLCAAPHLS